MPVSRAYPPEHASDMWDPKLSLADRLASCSMEIRFGSSLIAIIWKALSIWSVRRIENSRLMKALVSWPAALQDQTWPPQHNCLKTVGFGPLCSKQAAAPGVAAFTMSTLL